MESGNLVEKRVWFNVMPTESRKHDGQVVNVLHCAPCKIRTPKICCVGDCCIGQSVLSGHPRTNHIDQCNDVVERFVAYPIADQLSPTCWYAKHHSTTIEFERFYQQTTFGQVILAIVFEAHPHTTIGVLLQYCRYAGLLPISIRECSIFQLSRTLDMLPAGSPLKSYMTAYAQLLIFTPLWACDITFL